MKILHRQQPCNKLLHTFKVDISPYVPCLTYSMNALILNSSVLMLLC